MMMIPPPGAGEAAPKKKNGGRQPLAKHLKRERIVHDLADAEKHCEACPQDLRPIGEESSERYEYIPAQLMVIEDVCKKYACDCTVKTATKPPQPIEKSTAGASLLAQVIVAETGRPPAAAPAREDLRASWGRDLAQDHGRLDGAVRRSARSFVSVAEKGAVQFQGDRHRRYGREGAGPQTAVCRTGRIWPYCGDQHHPVIVYDYTPTRDRAGPEKFLEGYRGYLQADAYAGYDAFFKDPARGLTEVGCWTHARRYYTRRWTPIRRVWGRRCCSLRSYIK